MQLLATDFLQSVDLTSLVCTDVPASAYVFGVGGLSPPFDVSQLDAAQVEYAFAAGFLLVGMFWALGRAVSMVMSMVRR